MKERLETHRMSHCSPFYSDFFLQKLNFKDWIYHSAVICGPYLYKHAGTMKTMLDTNIYGYKAIFKLLLQLFGSMFFNKPDIFLY